MAGLAAPRDPLASVGGSYPVPICFRSLDAVDGGRAEAILPPDIPPIGDVAADTKPEKSSIGIYFGPDLGAARKLYPILSKLSSTPTIYTDPVHAGMQSVSGLNVRDRLFTPLELASSFALFIHHGGLGITQICAAAGTPQLVLHTDLEKSLNGAAVAAHQSGISLNVMKTEGDEIVTAANALMHSAGYWEGAMSWERNLTAERQAQPTVRIIADQIEVAH
jgi:hypothetical protein